MSKSVLIVDDDKALARALQRSIIDEGYLAQCVHDGEAALELIKKAPPGLVLLDLLLPRRDGRSVLDSLRASAATHDLPVIVMSGVFRGRRHAAEIVEAGAQAFLEKPFRRSDLSPLLKRHLGRPVAKKQKADASDAKPSGKTSLADHPVAELMWEVMEERRSGLLLFESAKRRKVVCFREGIPARVGSNLARECLGNRLVASGRIDSRALQESLTRVRSGEGRQGQVLVAMAALGEREVSIALESQVADKLLDLFGWLDGEAEWKPDTQEVAHASDIESWTPGELILRGVQQMQTQRAERFLAGVFDEKVAPSGERLDPRAAELPGVAALLARLESKPKVKDLPPEHAPLLYGLALIGAAKLLGGGSVRTRKGKGTAGAGSDAPVSNEELAAVRDRQAGLNHFDVLGVASSATPEEVHGAFVKLAKLYHPDRFRSASEEATQLAGTVFARMAEAYRVLADSKERRAYEESLRGAGAPKVNQIVAAESEFRKGEALFKKREYAQALEPFSRAVELNPDEGDFHCYYGWTYYLVHREQHGSRAKARDILDQGLRLAPNSANAHYLVGLFHRTCEDAHEAERMFRKVLDLDAKHVEASRELRLLNMRKERPSSGILGFGKKSK